LNSLLRWGFGNGSIYGCRCRCRLFLEHLATVTTKFCTNPYRLATLRTGYGSGTSRLCACLSQGCISDCVAAASTKPHPWAQRLSTIWTICCRHIGPSSLTSTKNAYNRFLNIGIGTADPIHSDNLTVFLLVSIIVFLPSFETCPDSSR
jgi:hypothetical protein